MNEPFKPTLILQMKSLVLTKDTSTEKDGITFYQHGEVTFYSLIAMFMKAQWCLTRMYWQQLKMLIDRKVKN